jgi:hypothetical protein
MKMRIKGFEIYVVIDPRTRFICVLEKDIHNVNIEVASDVDEATKLALANLGNVYVPSTEPLWAFVSFDDNTAIRRSIGSVIGKAN